MEKTIELLTYSNPRLAAVVTGWPWGQKLKATASFFVESNKRGQRCGRVIIDPRTNRPCAPKFTTYAKQVRIVDGSDGRTYVATLGHFNSSIQIVCGDMKYTREYPPAGIAGTAEHARHAQILALFDAEALTTDPPKGGEVLERDLGDMRAITDDSEPLAQANAEGRDITLSEGIDFLRSTGAQVLVIDENTDFSKLPKFGDLFGAPAKEGAPIKGTSGEGGAA